MKIFLPIKIQPTGGTSSFAKKFQKGMQQNGHQVFFKFNKDYDVLLVSPRCPYKYLLHAKLNKKRIIHRLDGVYYPATIAGWLFLLYNLPLIITRWFFADFTIYQSKYSKRCCDLFLGKKKKNYTIIYNGVDTDKFSHQGPKIKLKDNPDQHLFITASRFRRHDQIIPILEAFKIYQKKYTSNSKLIIIGNFTLDTINIPQKYKTKNIKFLGVIENSELPKYLRAADVFVFTQQNPPCPNNVIEAMACGLPICGINDGSMPELVSNNNGLLLNIKHQGFINFRQIDTKLYAKQYKKSILLSKKRSNIKHRFHINNMIRKYLGVVNQKNIN